jgi:hypothetical protein
MMLPPYCLLCAPRGPLTWLLLALEMVFELGLYVMKHLHFTIKSSLSLLKDYCLLEYEVM